MGQDEREHAELLMLYQQATQDIRTFQDRQTLVTNLTVLVYAALIALAPRVLTTSRDLPLTLSLRSEFPMIAVTTALGSLGWLVALQVTIRRARRTIDRTKAHFSHAFKLAADQGHTAGRLAALDNVPILMGAVAIGLLITLSILNG